VTWARCDTQESYRFTGKTKPPFQDPVGNIEKLTRLNPTEAGFDHEKTNPVKDKIH
jgi:hypothetical protein